MSNESPPPPAQPAVSVTPATVTAQPQQVTCPWCLASIPVGLLNCPKCGNSLLPPTPSIPTIPPVPAPRRPRTALVIGVVLITIVVAGVAGYAGYQFFQKAGPIARSAELDAANQAPNQIRLTCFSYHSDLTSIMGSDATGYTGYGTTYETFGMNNPTIFIIDGTWKITLTYSSTNTTYESDSVTLSNTQTFHLTASGTARPTWAFGFTGAQFTILRRLVLNPQSLRFTVSIDESYAVKGTYATYNTTHNDFYDSATGSGGTGGSVGTGQGLPQCP